MSYDSPNPYQKCFLSMEPEESPENNRCGPKPKHTSKLLPQCSNPKQFYFTSFINIIFYNGQVLFYIERKLKNKYPHWFKTLYISMLLKFLTGTFRFNFTQGQNRPQLRSYSSLNGTAPQDLPERCQISITLLFPPPLSYRQVMLVLRNLNF